MIVEFDAADFRARFPKFTEELITDAQLEQCFEIACAVLANDDCSRVPYDPERGVYARRTLLYLLVCHLATLSLWPAGQSGAVQSAAEGSVSTSFAVPQLGRGASWFALSPCGQTFWQASAPYRIGLMSRSEKDYHLWG